MPSYAEPLRLFGVSLIGATPENAIKLGITVAWVIGVNLIGRALRWGALKVAPQQMAFWVRQAISIVGALALVLGVLSIWFNDPKQLATAIGLVTAGVAFALQRVITAIAGYIVILRGTTFNVGDRIVMGGVRGDVIALNFMQTTVLEMGAVGAAKDEEDVWVHSRQYTGRVVTITNAKVFEDPIYNYSKELPYFWEEMRLPVPYSGDAARAEQILIEAAQKHTVEVQRLSAEVREALQERYNLPELTAAPHVYYRLTDNWVEMTVRFLTEEHGTRARKDRMSRDILEALREAGIEVASGTYAIVQVPKLQVTIDPAPSGENDGLRA